MAANEEKVRWIEVKDDIFILFLRLKWVAFKISVCDPHCENFPSFLTRLGVWNRTGKESMPMNSLELTGDTS